MSRGFAGAMRERIAIERRGSARDALGGAVGGWDLVRQAWAGVIPARPGVDVKAVALDALPHWIVTMRNEGAAVMPGDHVVWRGRRLMVRRIGQDPRTPDRVVLGTEEQR